MATGIVTALINISGITTKNPKYAGSISSPDTIRPPIVPRNAQAPGIRKHM
jgi:hypothetical protein